MSQNPDDGLELVEEGDEANKTGNTTFLTPNLKASLSEVIPCQLWVLQQRNSLVHSYIIVH